MWMVVSAFDRLFKRLPRSSPSYIWTTELVESGHEKETSQILPLFAWVESDFPGCIHCL